MKKNNKAFTLIELLAIIVILAIIAVITVPIILNIIENSRRGAVTDSAYGYKDAVSKWYISKLQDDTGYTLDGNYTISDGKLGDILIPISGDKPSSGYLNYSNNALIGGCLVFGEYEAVFDSKGSVSSTEKGTCLVKYTVTFDSKGGNSVESQQVSAGGKVQEPTNVTNGSLALDGWYTDETFTQKFDFNNTVSSNMTLYAYWLEPKYFSLNGSLQNEFLGYGEDCTSCYNDNNDICYGNKITKITVSKKLDIPEGAPTFDFNENVKAWLVDDGNNNGMYEMKIGANGQPRLQGAVYGYDFTDMNNLSYVNFDGLDASELTEIHGLFSGSFKNVSNATIDFGNNFNANNLTNAEFMINMITMSGTANLNINFGNNFNASKLTNAYDMLYLTGESSVNFGNNFNANNLTDAYEIVTGDSANTIDFGNNFNAISLVNASNMFGSSANTINFGNNFNAVNLVDASNMFGTVGNIDFGNNFNATSLVNASNMFNTIGIINFGNNFGGSNIRYADYMFRDFYADTLDISFMNLSNLQNYQEMFGYYSGNVIVKDENDRNWLINKKETENWYFDASNILVKGQN